MDNLKFTQVNSRMMSGYHYDHKSQALTIQFGNGGVYRYDNVHMSLVEEMASHDSPGSFFSKNIKNQHPTTRLS